MITKQAIAKFVLSALNGKVEVILLRGTDDHSRVGGDIDFIVPAGESAGAAVVIAEAACDAGWGVVGFRHLGYVAQICLIIPDPAGVEDTTIKIDLSDGLAWYALGDDPIGKAVFQFRRESGSETQTAALATFFQKILYPGFLRERDRDRIFGAISAADIEAFCLAHKLPVSFGEINAGRLESCTRWRLRYVSANVRGLNMLPWFITVMFLTIRARMGLCTGAGQIFGVAGMDGCGKSTLVDRFVRAVSSSEFTEPLLVHLLPDVIPMPHQVVKRKTTVQNYVRPYAEPPVQSRFSGFLRLGYYMVAFAAARIWCGLKTARGRTIVFDRSIVDFASDLARARIPHVTLPGWVLRVLLPVGRFYYLCAKPNTVVERKRELTLERATDLSAKYSATSKAMNIGCIDGERNANLVFHAFLRGVTDKVIDRARRWVR